MKDEENETGRISRFRISVKTIQPEGTWDETENTRFEDDKEENEQDKKYRFGNRGTNAKGSNSIIKLLISWYHTR